MEKKVHYRFNPKREKVNKKKRNEDDNDNDKMNLEDM